MKPSLPHTSFFVRPSPATRDKVSLTKTGVRIYYFPENLAFLLVPDKLFPKDECHVFQKDECHVLVVSVDDIFLRTCVPVYLVILSFYPYYQINLYQCSLIVLHNVFYFLNQSSNTGIQRDDPKPIFIFGDIHYLEYKIISIHVRAEKMDQRADRKNLQA